MTRRDLEEQFANHGPLGMPPSNRPTGTCRCGARYSDDQYGHDEHDVVFGHRPLPENGTAREGDDE